MSDDEDDDRRTREALRGRPPRLKLALVQRLKMLALLNILPLAIGAWVGYKAMRGEVRLRVEPGSFAVVVFVILLACAVVAISLWVLLPVGRWMRAYTTWQLRFGSAVAWVLPWLGAQLAYALIWIAVAASCIAALTVIGTGLWRLAEMAFA